MNRELQRAIAEAALAEARKQYQGARLHALLNAQTPAAMLPDGLAWYVEVAIDMPERLYSHAYEVQLTRDGELHAYGIGPGTLLEAHATTSARRRS